jgi:hypothetical protein
LKLIIIIIIRLQSFGSHQSLATSDDGSSIDTSDFNHDFYLHPLPTLGKPAIMCCADDYA